MNQDTARRRLPDLAAGELDPWTARLVRREIDKSLSLQREWQEITGLYAGIRLRSSVTPSLPAPAWRTLSEAARRDDAARPADDWATPPAGRQRFVLPVFAVGALITLFMLPLTGWLVRSQLAVTLGAGLFGPKIEIGSDDIDVAAIASRTGASYPIQLGRALMEPEEQGSMARWSALQEFRGNFSNDGFLDAALLDSMPPDELIPPPPTEEPELFGTTRKTSTLRPSDRGLVKAYLAFAEDGEKSDPYNMYFSFLRAYALVVDGRSDEAMNVVRKMRTKPYYRDYSELAMDTRWEALTGAKGETGILSRIAVWAGTVSPTMARQREMARRVVARAITLEKRGDIVGGTELRLALLHMGRTMQEQGNSYVTGLVGTAIGKAAMAHPEIKDEAARRERFYQDLLKQRRDADAMEVIQLLQWDQRAREDFEMVTKRDPLRIGLPGLSAYLIWFAICLMTLLSALWTLLFGGVAYALNRFGTMAPHGSRKIVGITMVSVTAFVGVAAVLVLGPVAFARQIMDWFGPEVVNAIFTGGSSTLFNGLVAIPLAMPVIALIVIAIMSRRRRLPVSVGMVRGFRRIAIPLASIHLLLYCGIAYYVAVQDADLRVQLSKLVRHERQFIGDLANKIGHVVH